MDEFRDKAHSIYGASAAHRWMRCPGSVRMNFGKSESSSVYAEEGTEAHALLERWVGCLLEDDDYEKSHNTLLVNAEMIDAVRVCVEYVQDILEENPDAIVVSEYRVQIPSKAAPGEVFGTVDIGIYIPSLEVIYVIDYKHGAGERVDLSDNEQLREYAVGLFASLPEWQSARTFILAVVQPRIFDFRLPIPEVVLTLDEIKAFHAEIERGIYRTEEPDAPLVAGEKQCRWCAASVECPARTQMALDLMGDTFRDVRDVTIENIPNPQEMTPDRIAYVLGFVDTVKQWFKDVERRAFEMTLSGVKIPGRKLVYAQAQRTWHGDEILAAYEIAEITGLPVETIMPPTLVGIIEAETMIKKVFPARKKADKEARKTAMEAFAYLTTKKSSGKVSLVKEDDNRPAINSPLAAFGDVQLTLEDHSNDE